MSYDERGVRAVRKVIEIGAPVEQVWRALTTGEGLRSWYLERADVQPGLGGTVTGGWGPIELPPATIEVWEPERHYRTSSREAGAEATAVTEEWILEGHGGTTTLRLVHSGFVQGTEWDESYDAVDHGWDIFLANLRYWLERHGGVKVRLVSLAAMATGSVDEVWRRLLAGFGTGLAGPEALAAGVDLQLAAGDGPALQAVVTQWAAPTELAATVSNDARLLISIMPGGEAGSYVALYLFCYGMPDDEVDRVAARLREGLAAMGELIAA